MNCFITHMQLCNWRANRQSEEIHKSDVKTGRVRQATTSCYCGDMSLRQSEVFNSGYIFTCFLSLSQSKVTNSGYIFTCLLALRQTDVTNSGYILTCLMSLWQSEVISSAYVMTCLTSFLGRVAQQTASMY